MNILRLTAQGLPLFKEELDITFYAKQRVSNEDRDKMYCVFENIYLNCANAFIGLNASGKTSVLKVLFLALKILNNEPINHIETRDILGDSKKAVLNIYFHDGQNEIGRLETVIEAARTKAEGIYYRIEEETLWKKKVMSGITRKSLTDFAGIEPVKVRDAGDEFLSEDVSIIIAQNKKNQSHMDVISLLSYTNNNVLSTTDDIPMEIIKFLDPTIEKLHFDQRETKPVIHLKFVGEDEKLLNSPQELETYLSSGTIKGIATFTRAREVLKSGGYLLVDEIENHFNKEIVATLIRFFMDGRINRNGGTLIFSTHYPELLDEYDRNDGIYITRNREKITVDNLTNILKRNDIKKSDAYQSGFLEGTTPMYEAYMELRKSIASLR